VAEAGCVGGACTRCRWSRRRSRRSCSWRWSRRRRWWTMRTPSAAGEPPAPCRGDDGACPRPPHAWACPPTRTAPAPAQAPSPPSDAWWWCRRRCAHRGSGRLRLGATPRRTRRTRGRGHRAPDAVARAVAGSGACRGFGPSPWQRKCCRPDTH
jgi:hypothetical protein